MHTRPHWSGRHVVSLGLERGESTGIFQGSLLSKGLQQLLDTADALHLPEYALVEAYKQRNTVCTHELYPQTLFSVLRENDSCSRYLA